MAKERKQEHAGLVIRSGMSLITCFNLNVLLAKVTTCPSSQPVIMYCPKLYITSPEHLHCVTAACIAAGYTRVGQPCCVCSVHVRHMCMISHMHCKRPCTPHFAAKEAAE
jgi:hypothetical protein